MAVHQIHGQAVTFTPSGCEDFCLMLVNGATEDFTPETSFCFQMPLFNDGSNLSVTEIDLDAPFNDPHSGTLSVNATPGCGGGRTDVFDNIHSSLSETGWYFMKYEIGSGTITYSAVNGISGLMQLDFNLISGSGTMNTTFDENSLSGSFKSTTVLTPSGSTSFIVYGTGVGEDDGTGTCYVTYSLTDLETDLYQLWQEETFTATDDTFYRLKFTNTNSTNTTVKIYDSASALIFQADSDPVGFDKIFKTGSLPVDKTVTIRYEIENFIDHSFANFEQGVLTDVSLFKQCQYDVDIEDTDSVVIATLGETHDTTAESTGVSYHPNIEYCLDTTYTEGCYQFRATNSCDGTDDYVSNCFTICSDNCDSGIEKQLSWDVDSVKCVGDDTIDGVAYPSTGFMWLKMDLQDPTYEEEREQYISSAGGLVTPWTQHRETEILVIWPVPPFVRRTIATAMMDTFYIDGVAYQKFDDDPYSPLFSARHNSAMRITVAKVGQHTTSKNV